MILFYPKNIGVPSPGSKRFLLIIFGLILKRSLPSIWLCLVSKSLRFPGD